MKQAIPWFLLGVTTFGVCAYGAVEAGAYAAVVLALAVLWLALVWKATVTKEPLPLSLPLWPLLFLALALLQMVPLPQSFLDAMPYPRHWLAGGAAGVSWDSGWRVLSAIPHESTVAICKVLGYLAAFQLAVWSFHFQKRHRVVLVGLIALGCGEAILGLAQFLTRMDHFLWYWNFYNPGVATGTYINRNHLAGLLEMTMPLAVGMSYYFATRPRAPAGLHDPNRESDRWRAALYGFLALLMFLGIVFSQSRAGITSGILSLLILGFLWRVKSRSGGSVLGLSLFFFCLLAYAAWIGVQPILTRFERLYQERGFELEGRFPLWTDAANMVAATPFFGSGLGTFRAVFPKYQSNFLNGIVEHAHNDYLEFAAETGLAGAALLFVPVFVLWVQGARRYLKEPEPWRAAVLLGTLGGLAGMLLHSASDFNLQIPANALVFAILLGLCYQACYGKKSLAGRYDYPAADAAQGATEEPAESPPQEKAARPKPALAWLLAVAATAGMLFLTVILVRHYRAERWLRQPTLAGLETAYQTDPDDAAVAHAAGRYLMNTLSQDPSTALPYLRSAARSSPADPMLWLNLGLALEAAEQPGQAAEALQEAVQRGPHLPRIAWPAANFHLRQGDIGSAFRLFRVSLAGDASTAEAVFATCWNLTTDGAQILQEAIPPVAAVEVRYLNFLVSRGLFSEAMAAWNRLLQSEDPLQPTMAARYLEQLIRTGRPAEARQVWEGVLRRFGMTQGTRADGNLVFNGEFEDPLVNFGFGWRTGLPAGVRGGLDRSAYHSPGHSFLIEFPGTANLNFRGLYQFVSVEPGRTYRLEGYLRAEDITTDSGPRFEVLDAEAPRRLQRFGDDILGTQGWTRQEITFTAGPDTRMILVRIARLPSRKLDNLIQGVLWVDDVTISPLTSSATQ